MKRVIVTLLICAVIAAVVLAIGLMRDRTNTPPIAYRFIQETWRGEVVGAPGEFVTKDFTRNIGGQVFGDRARRYAHQIGDLVDIKGEIERPVNDLDEIEVVLLIEFEKCDAEVAFQLRRPPSGPWLIDRVDFDIPEAFEREPVLTPMLHNGSGELEAYFRQSPAGLWVSLSAEEQARRDYAGFGAQSMVLPDQLGAFNGLERVGEPDELEPGRVRVRYRASFEKGMVDVEQTWVFHEVYWFIERLDMDVTPR